LVTGLTTQGYQNSYFDHPAGFIINNPRNYSLQWHPILMAITQSSVMSCPLVMLADLLDPVLLSEHLRFGSQLVLIFLKVTF
jgi:hypothetical protein